MSRVLLLKAGRLRTYQPSMVPPLGLLFLASVLRARGDQVALLDTRLARGGRQAVLDALQAFRPDVVGISALTFEREHAALLVRVARSWNPRVPVILGGPHATAMAHAALRQTGADVAVVGEGEVVIGPLVDALAAGSTPDLAGVVTAGSEPLTGPQPHAVAPDLAGLPLPAWDLVDLEEYARHPSMSSPSPWRYAAISTSRGCPWRCTFCHEIHGRRYRTRPMESVQAELDLLQRKLGHGVIEVLDDNFNAVPERGRELLQAFCRTDGRLRPSFPNGVRSDRIDDAMLDLLQRAGTRFISFAIETASPRLQKAIGKNLDLDAARRAIEGAAARHLYSNGFFMLGFPGETVPELLQTLRFSLQVPLSQALFFRVVPMPGTPLGEAAGVGPDDATAGMDDYFMTSRNLSAAPDVVMAAIQRLAWLAFYSRPRTAFNLARLQRRRVAAFGASLLLGRRKIVDDL